MNAADVLARAAARNGKTYYPHPPTPLHETAMVEGLKLVIFDRDDRIYELEQAIDEAVGHLKDHSIPRHRRIVRAREALRGVR